jgi:hypothetical protein
MTTTRAEKHPQRLNAPRENRAVVVHPAWQRLPDLVSENLSIESQADHDFQGRRLSTLCRQARRELLETALRWTSAYADVDPPVGNSQDLIFLAGHQPQMFHPGVWLKNFALGGLARAHQATAVNLIIDSDAISATSLRVPGGTAENPDAVSVPFDRPDPAVPYEERRIEDRALFESFGRRAAEQIGQLVPHPLIESFWPLVVDQSRNTDRLGACIARARHVVETRWGLNTLEIPQSWICDLESFHWLTAHLLAHLDHFSTVYNEAVREYRREYRIRSASHPVPDLAADGQWQEAPFWIWSAQNPRRRRLFARRTANEMLITDRQDINARLSLSPEGDASRAVEQLTALAASGVKIRSRALVTTLWARLVLGDLFIHGIGGGNYDLVTNRIIERFFHRTPPGFMVLSATLLLPVGRSDRDANSLLPLGAHPEGTRGEGKSVVEDPTTIDRQLRELTYHPERLLNGLSDETQDAPDEVRTLVDSKRRWIETPQTVENAKTRCRAIRDVNQSLQPWLDDLRRRLLERRRHAVKQEQARRILSWREYGFCLYPEESLREFIESTLPPWSAANFD